MWILSSEATFIPWQQLDSWQISQESKQYSVSFWNENFLNDIFHRGLWTLENTAEMTLTQVENFQSLIVTPILKYFNMNCCCISLGNIEHCNSTFSTQRGISLVIQFIYTLDKRLRETVIMVFSWNILPDFDVFRAACALFQVLLRPRFVHWCR